MKDLHPSQLLLYMQVQQKTQTASWGLCLAAWIMLFVGVSTGYAYVRATCFGVSGLLVAVAKPIRKLAISTELSLEDAEDVSTQAAADWWFKAMRPQADTIELGQAELEPASPPYDWQSISTAPHLFLLGSTGDGKTTLARWLLTLLPGATLVLDPHDEPDKWSGLQVVGTGRDFAGIADALGSVYALMLLRFEELAAGVKDFPVINLVIDEFPAIAAKSSESSEAAKIVMPALLREARKVGIRVILLAQGSEVKTLGCEGEGSIRDQLQFVRLGKFAKAHAKRQGLPLPAGRPCLVEDEIALIPDLTNFSPSYPPADLPEGLRLLAGG